VSSCNAAVSTLIFMNCGSNCEIDIFWSPLAVDGNQNQKSHASVDVFSPAYSELNRVLPILFPRG
jgi:hypothetical protein